MAMYRLTEPFYDNLVLWDEGDEIEFDGTPSPSMIPLDDEAKERIEALFKARGEAYVPPLSELPDTMDGKVTVAAFSPGSRKVKTVTPAFPQTPGKDTSMVRGAKGTKASGEKIAVQPMAQMPNMPSKAPKNFDRAPK